MTARAASRLAVQAIAGVYALEHLVRRFTSILALPNALNIVSAFVASLAAHRC